MHVNTVCNYIAPFDLSLLQGNASALETAAAEMGQAAASLVAIERQIGELTQEGVRS